MDLTSHEEELITQTFAEIAPQVDKATDMFYERLFDVMPSTKEMFGDGEQRFEMFNILATAVKSLSYAGDKGPDLTALGGRHVTYGVTLEQFDVVEQVLMWTFKQILGDSFTAQAHVTWVKVYGLLRERVIQGNYSTIENPMQVDAPQSDLNTGKLESPISDTSAPQTGDLNQQEDATKPLTDGPRQPATDVTPPQVGGLKQRKKGDTKPLVGNRD
jgi:nitric oxide dioxygenase